VEQPLKTRQESTASFQAESLLSVRHLSVDFVSQEGRVHVLNDISFDVRKGEIVGVVGESGSGKTTLGLATLRLLDIPPAEIVSGEIVFDGKDISNLRQGELSEVRGTGMNMVFQESLISLNPVYKVESQLKESIGVRDKKKVRKEDTKSEMLKILRELCLDRPEMVLKRYPHELSGGMRQRVSIAMSTVQSPKLLFLDEPTTGLDAYVQNRILQIVKKLNSEFGLSIVLITHDLSVASKICNRIYVMYAGRVVEIGTSREILERPFHPYSESLLAALPNGFDDSPPLPVPGGEPPDLKKLPRGCKFNPRCIYVMDICKKDEPALSDIEGREVACWKYPNTIRK
jgi:oligopeptide/dipeptide ABC transporter ATP-binding protein